ncbi:hypothetical protein EUX98_g7731 [Antrodiella citrinella]|uniref:Oxidoreductase AflY n=1 Tax=Antrodiella citrinella TaxID=2447956 RepID=A0A4S4MLC5_9APHY|nr:hypothetical protein EUX98_g7731 [Antrodiella citrinella]
MTLSTGIYNGCALSDNGLHDRTQLHKPQAEAKRMQNYIDIMNTPQGKLDALFTVPTLAPRGSALTPSRLAGPDTETADALIESQQHNHKNLHIFFNDAHFHNHAAHHVLAIYALGASPELIRAAYSIHKGYQRPAVPPAGVVTKSNWKEHLGDEQYYQSYLMFFTDLLLTDGPAVVLQEYIFSKDANFTPAKGKTERPEMVNRFIGGFLHPLIHCGYGAEFGQLGMWAEALAETSVEHPAPAAIVPDALYEEMYSSADLASRVASLSLSGETRADVNSVHALTILARISKDPVFSPEAIKLHEARGPIDLGLIARTCIDKLLKYVDEWTIGTSQEELDKKIEELIWMSTVIYAVGGWGGRNLSEDESKEFNGDFFLMHAVTSAMFLPSLSTYLAPAATAFLLKAYLVTILSAYIIRGRPALPLADFFATVPTPTPPRPHATSSTDIFTFRFGPNPSMIIPPKANWLAVGADKIYTPNPWLPLIQSTLVHPDEHLCKLQRSLMHFASVLGATRPGAFRYLEREVEGAGKLDGTLFVRAAGLTANRLGWIREGHAQKSWDFGGFFKTV